MKKITANWGLKLASLIFAVLIWFFVTNINDPVISVRYTNIPVTLKNTNLITDQGQIYTVLDNSDVINSVTIYAPRTVIDSLSQSNIVATADVTDLSSLNTVSINVDTNKYRDKIENIVLSSDVVKLSVERKASKTLALTATTSGTLSEGYVIGDVSTEQNMIRISGPESVVNRVSKASVDVDVTGFTSNIGTDADIVLYDSEGKAIETMQSLTMNIKTVRVNVVIYETKYVPVSYTVTGEPAAGYALTGEIESSPEEILIAGRSSVLSSVSEIKVNDEALSVAGLTGSLSTTVDLSKYLPSGVSFGDKEFSGTATVVVYVGAILDKTIDVDIRNIDIVNVPDGYKASVDDGEYDRVSLTVQGLQSAISGVNAANVDGTVDLSDLVSKAGTEGIKDGTYSIPVSWKLPERVSLKNPVEVYVKIEREQ